MSVEFSLYIISVLNNLSIILTLSWIFSLIILFISSFILIIALCQDDNKDDDFKNKEKCVKTSLKIFMFFSLLCLFIPSEKIMYLMLGSNYLKDSQLPTKVEEAIIKKLDEYIKEDK